MLIDYASTLRAAKELVPTFESMRQASSAAKRDSLLMAKAEQDMKIALNNHQREEDYIEEAGLVFDNPTAANVARLHARYPEHTKAVQSGWEALQESARTSQLTQMGTMFARIRNGNVKGAAELARKVYEAEMRAGTADEGDLYVVEALESGDPERVRQAASGLLIQMSVAVGPEKMGATWGSIREEERQQDRHASAVSKGDAEAEIATAEALSAKDYYDARAEHEAAEADIAESDARYRDRRNASDIEGRQARTAATRGREVRAASEAPAKASPRPTYVRYARDDDGNRFGYNRKTKKWERVR